MKIEIRAAVASTLGVRSAAFLGSLPRVAKSLGHADYARNFGRDLLTLKGALSGQVVLLIANGPSLAHTNWELFKGMPAVTLNRAYLSHREWPVRPVAHVIVNELVISQFQHDLLTVRYPLFLNAHAENQLLRQRTDTFFFFNDRLPGFQRGNPSHLWSGSTVSYVALQLLYWMNASTVIVLGLDHKFVTHGRPNSAVSQATTDTNHYRPDYFPVGTTWQAPDLATSEYAYGLAKRNYDRAGKRIINCSASSACEVFPRMDAEEAAAKFR